MKRNNSIELVTVKSGEHYKKMEKTNTPLRLSIDLARVVNVQNFIVRGSTPFAQANRNQSPFNNSNGQTRTRQITPAKQTQKTPLKKKSFDSTKATEEMDHPTR